jgi:hypothetical protein
MRYELTDNELAAVRPLLPIKPRGVPRVDDRYSTASFGSLIRRRSSRHQLMNEPGSCEEGCPGSRVGSAETGFSPLDRQLVFSSFDRLFFASLYRIAPSVYTANEENSCLVPAPFRAFRRLFQTTRGLASLVLRTAT